MQLQPGDKVQGRVCCHMDHDGQPMAGQTFSLTEGVPVEIKDETQWCATLDAAAERSLYLFVASKPASPGQIQELEPAQLNALAPALLQPHRVPVKVRIVRGLKQESPPRP